MWVLTREINQYDQEGEYFISVFEEKPSQETIMKVVRCNEKYANHILQGGGRIDTEDDWYFLKEYKHGEVSEKSTNPFYNY